MKALVLAVGALASSAAFAHRWTDFDSNWQTIQFVDLNHDGMADVCGRDYDGIQCALSDGASFGPLTLWSAAFSNAAGWGAADNWWKTIQFADVTGDGLPDVCARRADGIVCGVSDGTHFGPLAVWGDEFKNSGGWQRDPSYWSTIRFPDVNGDGKADVCGRGINGMMCGVSTGTAFTLPTVWGDAFRNGSSFERSPNYQTLQFVDVNGDGMMDVCGRGAVGAVCAVSTGTSFLPGSKWSTAFIDGGGWNILRFGLTVAFVDLNGDGMADVCGRGEAAMYCQIGDGTTFLDVKTWTGTFTDNDGWGAAPNRWMTLRYQDLTGDGRMDLCGRNDRGIWCGVAGDERFSASMWSMQFGDADGWNSVPYYWQTIRFPDVNGDGKADVCGRFYDGMRCATSTGDAFGDVRVWSTAFGD